MYLTLKLHPNIHLGKTVCFATFIFTIIINLKFSSVVITQGKIVHIETT